MKRRQSFLSLLCVLLLSLFTFLQAQQHSVSTSQSIAPCREFVLKLPVGVAEQIKAVALTQVGVTEVGQNRGEPDKYNKSVNSPLGAAYCQAHWFWCGERTCCNPYPKTGLASLARKDLEKKSHQRNSRDAIRQNTFAMVYWQFPNSIYGHADGQIQQLEGGWVLVIAPNSSDDDPRNGGGVNLKKRNLNHPLARMRLQSRIYFI